ncbi:unnamed protein product [Thlaspi arvense]|uniref:RPM1 interacting protein 13 n=1 Tax=Thlaspi arvense TaxID=13288 RepID=A0AAU9T4X9_THLAR|nr:unnamed protein product [Thlaspi arvense]
MPMTSMNHIIYLSSDEEDAKVVDCTAWLDGVLETSDEKPKGTGHRKSNSSNPDEDGDDDCVVLDGDPYKTTENESAFDTCEADDEILVVGQKGEIACRDFPHPRHACAKYPFNSISHEKYCDMCHCYVCDIRAPCPFWSYGNSSLAHCHANDKEQIWKNHRECVRTGEIHPRPASNVGQMQQISQSQSIRSSQNTLYSPATQFGFRACSASTTVATRPHTYTGTEQSTAFPQNPWLPSLPGQLSQSHRGGSYNGYASPQVVSSNSFTWTQRPSRGANLPGNGVHNVAPVSQYTGYAPPAASLQQVNSRRNVTGHISTVPESESKVYGRHLNRNMYTGISQTSAVPSENLNPPANQLQPGKSNAKVLSEIEDWLMDSSTSTDPVCPLTGQANSSSLRFDFESFFQ